MLKKMLSFLMILSVFINIPMPIKAAQTINKAINTKADIVLVIDSTGSMGSSINNVKTNISDFAEYLDSLNIDLRMAVVEFKDITVSGEENSTIVHQLDHSPWHYTSDDFIQSLNKINANGGGDGPETLIDGLGKVLDDESMLFRSDANKFVIALTDATYKINNNYGYTGLEDITNELGKQNIYTSIITSESLKNTYQSLYQSTGGIFGNITSNFTDILKNFANSILGITNYMKKAIYVLPGYMGSKLYDDENNEEFWLDADKVQSDIEAYTYPGGKKSIVIRNSDGSGSEVHTDILKDQYGAQDTYEKLITKLQDEVGDDYDIVFFPYDWLGDLNESSKKLEEHITSNNYDKVILLTHSTGGLLASNFIAQGKANKRLVEKAILVAPPLYGTYTALQPVETGKTAELDDMLADNGVENSFGIKYRFVYRWIRAVTHSSPTTYQLFPSEEYLKLMPILYKDDLTNPVTTSSDYYKTLNQSKNINSNLTNGNNRSHAYFRDTVLKGDIVSELQQVDTILIGSSYGHMTPAIALYKKNIFGNYNYNDIIYKNDGDGTVLGVSAFATRKAGEHILPYKDFKNVTHGGLVSETEPLNYICDVIKNIAPSETKTVTTEANENGMSDYIKFIFQSDVALDVNVYDETGKKLDIHSTKDDIRYLELANEEKEYRALLYVPNKNHKVILSNDDNNTKKINVTTTVSTLDYDGYKTASAICQTSQKDKSGQVLSFDMSNKKVNVNNLGLLISDKEVPVQKFYTDWDIESSVRLSTIGDSKQIELTGSDVVKGEISYHKLKWYSSDSSIAEVSNNGVLKANGNGTATISAIEEQTGKALTCEVTVMLNANSISFENLEMTVNEKTKIKPIFNSDKVTERSIDYTYDKNGIIDIDEFGVITALKSGEVTVTGTAPGGATGSFTVRVYNGDLSSVQAITVSPNTMALPLGDKQVLTANIYPQTATNTGIRWHIEDSSIASIESDGLSCEIKGLKRGTTTVTAVSLDGGYTATSTITVIDKSNLTISSIENAELQILDLNGRIVEGLIYAEVIGEGRKSVYLNPDKSYIVKVKVADGIGFNVRYNGQLSILPSSGELLIKLRKDQMNKFELIKGVN